MLIMTTSLLTERGGLFWTGLKMNLERFVFYQDVKSGPRQVVSAWFSKLASSKITTISGEQMNNGQALSWPISKMLHLQFLMIMKH
jgi:hypothetical protein